jgi:FkbM family methyltransferase
LREYFDGPGFFIEAGAVDGFFESNTYHLETYRGWSGILIEPVPEMYKRLAINRPKAITFNCALVSPEFDGSEVPLSASHATSKVTLSNLGFKTNHESTGETILVPARTLNSILKEVGVSRIDLLSLDVEGFEIETLRGLDFMNFKPRYILVECLNSEAKTEMDRFLYGHYDHVDSLSHRDYLYRARDT